MYRISLLALLAAASFAQDAGEVFNKPPARVDQALRERINQFYQFHMKQEFRKAESLVAPDTKEYFYSHNKPSYLSCETTKIVYSDGFKKAKATETCEQFVMVPGFADKPLKVPFGSTWKLMKGKWFWYVDQEALRNTPFGKGTPGPGGQGGLPAIIPENADFVMSLVKADKEMIGLRAGQSETVTFHNGAPGVLDVAVVATIPGIEAKFDHTSMKVGDQAKLTLVAGDGAKSGTIAVRVDPTGQVIRVKVNVE